MTFRFDTYAFDIETYPNYFCVAFKSVTNGNVVIFEQSPDTFLDIESLQNTLANNCLIGFNSTNYDIPMIYLALTGASNADLKVASDWIIKGSVDETGKKIRTTWYGFTKKYKLKIPKLNHIDLFNICPVNGGLTDTPASLKTYAGRLHAPRMQDLPYHPDLELNQEQAQIVRQYCCNDLDNTILLYKELSNEIRLRQEMSELYGEDLRSKSDAQLGEKVITAQLIKKLNYDVKAPPFNPKPVSFVCPQFIGFRTSALQQLLQHICSLSFPVNGLGSPTMDEELKKQLVVTVGKSTYQLGMGGLHSNENQVAHVATDDIVIADNDVASFYPQTILNQKLYPEHLGSAFLEVYEEIVKTRLTAKKLAATDPKWKTHADSLKITINGSFGKLGNRYSAFYAPQLMLQVTITGQLVLLMLIEALELAGIQVISANTDGVILKYHKGRHNDVRAIIASWEAHTGYLTEETRYKAIYSRDVNNYIAVKEKGNPDSPFLDEQLGCKTKGTYSERGSALNSVLSKNPETLICIDAVLRYIVQGVPLEKTILDCKDFRRFVFVRNVSGGGQKDGYYLGKVVRWYYGKNHQGCIETVKKGHKVANSDGAIPVMDMPTSIPVDIDYAWYRDKAIDLLYDCARLQKVKQRKLF